ncbi:MAG TPA: hypothetical protein VK175_10105 [Leadbetterella sp.]|nr:hypothetical protein [Leadbetterella sp.]
MKKLFTIGALLFAGTAFAQNENVGIGTAQPDKSAILDLSSSNKGFLLPRMSESQRLNIIKPAQGLQVYQTDGTAGLYVYNGKNWENASKSVAAATDPWLRGGNAALAGEFLGTTGIPLQFKVGGVQVGLLAADNFTFFGYEAGLSNSGSTHNTALGFRSLKSNVTGIRNVAIGSQALQNNTNNDNVAIGFNALQSNVSGNNNVALGLSALRVNNGGSFNLGLAAGALENNLSGNNNVGIGYAAGYNNSTGSNNVAIGAYSLFTGSAISGNTAIGSEAGRNATGSNNIFIGPKAGYSETTSNKLYIATNDSNMPLIYGDFSAKYVTIGDVSPALRTQGVATGGYNLLVKGGILTEKVKVALAAAGTDWADYVFEPDYKSKMMSLEEVEAYALKNKHLPNVPSAQEMVNNGLDVSQTSKMFMEKIEELTLYIIELNKQIQALKAVKK